MRALLYTIAISGLVFAGCSSSSGSGKSGKIVTFGTYISNGDPVPSAEVKAGGESCITDDEGFCEVKLKVGDYEVTATKNGYEPYSDMISITDDVDGFYFGLLMYSSGN
ncbi:MAG: carboxypeptidase-like regulatory domain-containing protein [Balneolaceae bacterium]|nr:carboxypeptidase-like regulatory domain-containing protein [Balneolaceae bacterium]